MLGAGISGLYCAQKLSEKGISVSILEKENYIGGLASTIYINNRFFDKGPHFITTQNQKILNEILNLFSKDELLQFKRRAKILFCDRYLNYPLTAKNVLFQLSLKHCIKFLLSYINTYLKRIFRKKEEDNFEDWAINNFSYYLYSIFFKPYTEQFWLIPCNELSIDCIPLVTKMSFLKTLKMLFFKKFSKKSLSICERETVLPLYYPKRGIGELPKKIYEKVLQNGGKILLNCDITRITKANDKWEIEYKNNNELKNIQCDYLVSTIPIFDLIEYFQNIKSEEIIEALNKLGYLSLIVVNIIIKNNRTFDWSYLYTINRIYKRISNIKDFSPFACSSNENILALEITCNFNDNI
ncbi:MAG TPA: FAD-dependent oxidoreductase [bacterium]|nr:FAD-dependent oxidoreductase [bacterium]